MPVGTSVTLTGDVQATVAVTRVHEGIGAGMVVLIASSRMRSRSPARESARSQRRKQKEKKEKRKKKR